MGYLYRHLKERHYYFRCLNFVTSFAVALQTAVSNSVTLKLFVPGEFVPARSCPSSLVCFCRSGVFFLINILGIGLIRPYQ